MVQAIEALWSRPLDYFESSVDARVVVVRQTHFGGSLQLHPELRTTDPIVDLPADALESGLEPTEHLKWLRSRATDRPPNLGGHGRRSDGVAPGSC